MLRRGVACWLLAGGTALLAWMVGCRSTETTQSAKVAPRVSEADLTPTHVEYVDTDAFDSVFENALVNQDPAVIVHSGSETPDWGPRLNAWVAAWNSSANSRPKPTVRGQAPVPKVTIDADSIREFRLLIDSLFTRVDEVAMVGSTWYRDQRERSRRVSLLRPYNLRFHKDKEGMIDLIFFHEQYSGYYSRFVQKLMESETARVEWSRSVECSMCSGAKVRSERIDP